MVRARSPVQSRPTAPKFIVDYFIFLCKLLLEQNPFTMPNQTNASTLRLAHVATPVSEYSLTAFVSDHFERSPSTFFLVVCRNEEMITVELLEKLRVELGIPLPDERRRLKPLRVVRTIEDSESIVSIATIPDCFATIYIGRKGRKVVALLEKNGVPQDYISFIHPEAFAKDSVMFVGKLRHYLEVMREFAKKQDDWV